MSRPPPPDQPSPEETAALHAELVAEVALRQKLKAARVIRGPGSRRIYVALENDGQAWLALVELGQLLAERTVPAATLLDQLGAARTFDNVLSLLHPLGH